MTSTTISNMPPSKTSPEEIYGWKTYTEREVGKELYRLYKDKDFIEFSIQLGLNQLKNIRHKFSVANQEKNDDIVDYLQRFYKDLEQIEKEIDYFEIQQSYYEELQMRNEDYYSYY
jgi:hypothetical protein